MAIQQNFPNIKPTLLLDFSNTKALDPRITFTRASSGRFYDGVTTAKAEENLLLRSQEFDNAAWIKARVSITANSAAAPDGTTTADTISENNATGSIGVYQDITTTASSSYTFSCFVKDIDRRYVQLTLWGGSSAYISAAFDLTAETFTTAAAGAGYSVTSASIINVGNGWFRCSIIGNVGATTATLAVISPIPNGTAADFPSYAGTTLSFFAWGAQLEQR